MVLGVLLTRWRWRAASPFPRALNLPRASLRVLSTGFARSRSPYEVLGITPGASEKEIKDAYRKSAMRFHPDRNPGDTQASEKFQELSQAYAALSKGGGGGGGGGGGAGSGSGRSGGFGAGFSQTGRRPGFDPRSSGARYSQSNSDESRRQFEQLFGDLEQMLREMERQRAGAGFADSRFGARSQSVRNEVVRLPDGRMVLRTTTTTFGADGSHRVDVRDQPIEGSAGFGGFGQTNEDSGPQSAWRREQLERQAAAQRAAQAAASTMTGLLWRAFKQSAIRALRRTFVDPVLSFILGKPK